MSKAVVVWKDNVGTIMRAPENQTFTEVMDVVGALIEDLSGPRHAKDTEYDSPSSEALAASRRARGGLLTQPKHRGLLVGETVTLHLSGNTEVDVAISKVYADGGIMGVNARDVWDVTTYRGYPHQTTLLGWKP